MTPKSLGRRMRDRVVETERAASAMIGQVAVEAEALAVNGRRTTAALETVSTTMAPESWAAAGLDAPAAVGAGIGHRVRDVRVTAGAIEDGAGVAARPVGPLDLSQISPSDLAFLSRDWALLARPEQLPPDGDWRSWLILGGRGSGKTRAGAEWVQAQVLALIARLVAERGLGLMLAIELDRPCGELVKKALANGLLINVTAEKVVRLLPPLVISDAHTGRIVGDVSQLVEAFLTAE